MKGPPYSVLARLPVEVEEPIIDESEIPSIRHTLILLRSKGRILLVRKKKNRKITVRGIGGKLDPGETPYDAAARYLYEYGIDCRKMKLLGLIELTIDDGIKRKKKFHIHILSSTVFFGTPKNKQGIRPFWVRCTKIPYRQMPADYCIWMPFLLQGVTFKGAFVNRNKKTVLNYKISIVYRGVDRDRDKSFGHPPICKWQDLSNSDRVGISNAFYEANPYDINLVDQLGHDKTPGIKNDSIFSAMKSYLDERSEDDCFEIMD